MNSSTATIAAHTKTANSPLLAAERPADSTLRSLHELTSPSAVQPIVLAHPPHNSTVLSRKSETAPDQPLTNAIDRLAPPARRNVRNGKIARLPKLHRDMVNRMLQNNIPHSKIVRALGACDIFVTERNISNWRTRGGYQEWCLEQERQLQLSNMQDHLTDYLRKNDAQQLPEVGLQVAATQLSSLLLNPEAVRQLTAEPEKYSKVVDMLCRLSTHIQTLQEDRNEAVKKASYRDTAEHMKREKEKEVDIIRHVYSCERLGNTAYEPDIPHRNELPPRDELLYQNPPPKITMQDLMQHMSQKKKETPPNPLSSPAGLQNPPPGNPGKQ